MEEALYRKISCWVRQSRHRAKKFSCINQLDLQSALLVAEHYSYKCAYCDKQMCGLDHAFLLSDGAPNVNANTVPICETCKCSKKQHGLISYYDSGKIDTNRYLTIIKKMLCENGADALKDHIRAMTGIGLQFT